MTELWKPAVYLAFDGTKFDLGNRLLVSNLGSLKYNPEHTATRRGCKSDAPQILVKEEFPNSSGYAPYLNIRMWVDGVHKRFLVHRIVLSTWDEIESAEGLDCDHINGDVSNNTIENLRWRSVAENRGKLN